MCKKMVPMRRPPRTRIRFVELIRLHEVAMRRLLTLILCAVAPAASAGTWSVGVDAGPARLDSRHHDDADVDTRAVLGLRAAWWLNRNFAFEGGLVYGETGYRTGGEDFDRDSTSLLLGARAQAGIGDRSFVYARGGYARHRIDIEGTRVRNGTATFIDADSDSGHYLGAGFGWRWNERWSSSVEVARLYGDVAYGCDDTGCGTVHSSYHDMVTFGIAFDFE
jgi:hypothetical protein